MDIYEDDIYVSEGEEKDELSYLPDDEIDEEPAFEPEKKTETGKPSTDPGTRIIYQAPEKTLKRKFTGFKDEEEIITETEEETIKNEYKGGFAFEEEMRKKNTTPVRRVPQQRTGDKKPQISLEEEKRRRYEASLKRAEEEKAERARLAQLKKERLIENSDMEEIDIDPAKGKKRTTGDKIRIAVMTVAIIAMIGSVAVLVKQYVQQRQVAQWEDEVTGLIIDVPEDDTDKNKDNDDKKDEDESTTERPLTIEEQWEKLHKDYPDVVFPEGLSLKYAKLYAVNQDFVGYLSIDEYGMELPVVQSQKDTKKENYYLRRNFYKQYSVYGCPFVFKDSDMENLDRNTVIFGHNTTSNLAFAAVNKYKTLDGYKNAPVIQFDTIYANHKWKVVAAFIINTKASDDNGYIFNYIFTKMENDEEFMTYMKFLKERSLYDTGVDILPSDKILTLSTCTKDFDDARFVVVARLVRPGETEDVNTSIAKVNESPRYPQAYYDKKKKKNPYKDAERWYYSGD